VKGEVTHSLPIDVLQCVTSRRSSTDIILSSLFDSTSYNVGVLKESQF